MCHARSKPTMPDFSENRRRIRTPGVNSQLSQSPFISNAQVSVMNAQRGHSIMAHKIARATMPAGQPRRSTSSRDTNGDGVISAGERVDHIERPDGSLIPVAAATGDPYLVRPKGADHYVSPRSGDRFKVDPASPTGLLSIGSARDEAMRKAAEKQAKEQAAASKVEAKAVTDADKATAKAAAEAKKLANAKATDKLIAEGRAYHLSRETGTPLPVQTDEEFKAAKAEKMAKLQQEAAAKPYKKRLAELQLELDNPDLPKVSEKDQKDADEEHAAAATELMAQRGNDDLATPLTDDEVKAALADPLRKDAAAKYLAAKEKAAELPKHAAKRKALEKEVYETKKRILDPLKYAEDLKAEAPLKSDDELKAHADEITNRIKARDADVKQEAARITQKDDQFSQQYALTKQKYDEALAGGDPNVIGTVGDSMHDLEQQMLQWQGASQDQRATVDAESEQIKHDASHLQILADEQKKRDAVRQDQYTAALDAALPGAGQKYKAVTEDAYKRREDLQAKYPDPFAPEAKAAFEALHKDFADKAGAITKEVEAKATERSDDLRAAQVAVHNFANNGVDYKEAMKKAGLDPNKPAHKEAFSDANAINNLNDGQFHKVVWEPGDKITKGFGTAVLSDGSLHVTPEFIPDAAKYAAVVEASDATPEAKAKAMAALPKLQLAFAESALPALKAAGSTRAAKWIPGIPSFQKWQAEKKREGSEVEQASEYLTEMGKRGELAKITDNVLRSTLAGFADIGTMTAGVAGMTGLKGASELAADWSQQTNKFTAPISMEGGDKSIGSAILGQTARMAGPMAAQLLITRGLGGGMASMAALAAGQTAGSQYAESYGKLREEGMTHKEAWKRAAPFALASGAVTAMIDAAGGRTGFAAALGQKAGSKAALEAAKHAADGYWKNLLRNVPREALAEIPKEFPDEMFSQISQALAEDPHADVSQVVGNFMENAPAFLGAVALMGGSGGVMETNQEFKKKVSDQPPAPDLGEAPSPTAVLPEHTAAIGAAIDNWTPTGSLPSSIQDAAKAAHGKEPTPEQHADTARTAAHALVDIANGQDPRAMSPEVRRALGIKTNSKTGAIEPLSKSVAPLVESVAESDKEGAKHHPVITDAAREWLAKEVPTAAEAIKSSYAERVEQIKNPPKPAKKPKAAPKAKAETPAAEVSSEPGEFAPTPVKSPGETDNSISEPKGATSPSKAAESVNSGQSNPKLPRELASAKPSYSYGKKQFSLEFESDIDRAAYIAAQEKPSKRDADFVAFVMKHTGMNEAAVRAHGASVRAYIKPYAAEGQHEGTILIPSQLTAPQKPIAKTSPKEPVQGASSSNSDAQAQKPQPAEQEKAPRGTNEPVATEPETRSNEAMSLSGGALLAAAEKESQSAVSKLTGADKQRAVIARDAILATIRRYNGHLPIDLSKGDDGFSFSQDGKILINVKAAIMDVVDSTASGAEAKVMAEKLFDHEVIHLFATSKIAADRVKGVWNDLPQDVKDAVIKAYSIRRVAMGQPAVDLNDFAGGHEYFRAMIEATRTGVLSEQAIGPKLAEKWKQIVLDFLAILKDLKKQFASIKSEAKRTELTARVEAIRKEIIDALDQFERSITPQESNSPGKEPAQAASTGAVSTTGTSSESPVKGSTETVAAADGVGSITNEKPSSRKSAKKSSAESASTPPIKPVPGAESSAIAKDDPQYPYKFEGWASTNEGGRLAVEAGGNTVKQAQDNAMRLLSERWHAREAKRVEITPPEIKEAAPSLKSEEPAAPKSGASKESLYKIKGAFDALGAPPTGKGTPLDLSDAISAMEAYHEDPADPYNWPEDLQQDLADSPMQQGIDNNDFAQFYEGIPADQRTPKFAQWAADSKSAETSTTDIDLDDAEAFLESDKAAKMAKAPFLPQVKDRVQSTIAQIDSTGRYKWNAKTKTFDELDEPQVLFQPPESKAQVGLPKERRAAFLDVAESLINDGVNTPEGLALALTEARPDGSLQKYSQALWNFFGTIDPDLTGHHDWQAIYAPKAEEKPTQEPAPTAALPKKRKKLGKNPLERYDLLDYLNENKIILPPKDQRTGKGEYDWLESGRISPHYLSFITSRADSASGASNTPDAAAQAAFDAGLIDSPSTDALAEAIHSAIAKRVQMRAEQSRLERVQKTAAEQIGRFNQDKVAGATPVNLDTIHDGDQVVMNGHVLDVIGVDYDEDGYTTSVTLRDSDTYGVQTLQRGDALAVDEVIPAKREAPADDPFALDTETDEQATERLRLEEQKKKIDEKQVAKLTGTAGEFGTSDMFDNTAGPMALFNQGLAKPNKGADTSTNDSPTSSDLERDQPDAGTRNTSGTNGVQPGRRPTRGNGKRMDATGAGSGDASQGGSVPADVPAALGGDTGRAIVREPETGTTERPAGDSDTRGSGNADELGVEVEQRGADEPALPLVGTIGSTQPVADSGGTSFPEIKQSAPALTEDQAGDVAFIERRLATKPGVLLTNGTGTGKTFSGMGAVKRMLDAGKQHILIAAPSDKVVNDWIATAKEFFGVNDIVQLGSTQDNGSGNRIAVTTYANLGQNDSLVNRPWDAIVTDEAHYLSQNKDGNKTGALDAVRALTLHRNGAFRRADMENPKEAARLSELAEMARKNKGVLPPYLSDERKKLWRFMEDERSRIQAKIDETAEADRPKVVMLSATPFAYHFSLDYAEGYLYDFPPENQKTVGRYNHPSPRSLFYMENFGYRMRTGKLTAPENATATGILERRFAERLMKSGAMSGRALQVDQDYGRHFVLTESELGTKIDEIVSAIQSNDYLRPLAKFIGIGDYLERRYLLEALKARESVERIKQHMKMGRKVVIFHDYKKGGSENPLRADFPDGAVVDTTIDGQHVKVNLNEALAALKRAVPHYDDTMRKLGGLMSPLQLLTQEFPEIGIFNGDVPSKKRREVVNAFNKSGGDTNIILVQRASGKEGISLHDRDGKHQRVFIDLGIPGRPTDAIQSEGRIYRHGVMSNAIVEYLTTGTGWERQTFAQTIAQRASTAENLAMGERARALLQAFATGYMDAEAMEPSDKQGTGGKSKDAAILNSDPFKDAVALYYTNAKKTSRNKSAEGIDYFSTPEPLGFKMVEWAGIRPGEKVLEPSAGHGAIARFFPDSTNRHAVEPSSELASKLALNATDVQIHSTTFEDYHIGNKFDAIVMNPPFGTAGKTAMDHLIKATGHLRNGGRIVALIPEGSSMEKRFDKWMDSSDAVGIYMVAEYGLPSVAFERAGTSVKARVVILDKTDDPTGLRSRSRRDFSGDTPEQFFASIKESTSPDRAMVAKLEKPAQTEELEPASMVKESIAPVPSIAAPNTFVPDETFHVKKGKPTYVAKISRRLSSEEYAAAKAIATKNSGYYSKYASNGAIPGFQFDTVEDRDAFLSASMLAESLGQPPAGRDDPGSIRNAKRIPYRGLFKDKEASHGRAITENINNRARAGQIIRSFERDWAPFFVYIDDTAPYEKRKAALHKLIDRFAMDKTSDVSRSLWEAYANIPIGELVPEDTERVKEAKELLPFLDNLSLGQPPSAQNQTTKDIHEIRTHLKEADAGRSEYPVPTERLKAQAQSLSEWAVRNNRTIEPQTFADRATSYDELGGGEEHDVWYAEGRSLGQPPTGYRSPSDMLASTQAQMQGKPGEKPAGLNSMFNPKVGRPATGERTLFETPKKPTFQSKDLHAAYQRAIHGTSTTYTSIRSVFDAAKKDHPSLSADEFKSQLKSDYYAGLVGLEPAEQASSVEKAGQFTMRDSLGVVHTNMVFMPTTEAEAMDAAERDVTSTPDQILSDWAGTETLGTPPSAQAFREWRESNYNEETERQLPDDYFDPFVPTIEPPTLTPIFTRDGVAYKKGPYSIVYAIKGGMVIGFVDGKAIQVSSEMQKRGIGSNLLDAYKEMTGKEMRLGSHTNAGFNLFLKRFEKQSDTLSQNPAPIDPTVANQGDTDENREAFARARGSYITNELTKANFDEIRQKVEDQIDEDEQGVLDNIQYKVANDAELSLEEEIARRMLANTLRTRGVRENDQDMVTLADSLWGQDIRDATATARKLAVRVDQFQSPQERLDAAMGRIIAPNRSKLRERLTNVWTPSAKRREIARLEAEKAAATTDASRARLEKMLAEAKARMDQNDLIDKMAAENNEAVDKILKRVGLTQADLTMTPDDRHSLQTAVMDLPQVKNAMVTLSPEVQKAIEMSVRGYTDAAIARDTGLKTDVVERVTEHFRNVTAKQAISQAVTVGKQTLGGFIEGGKNLIRWILKAPPAPLQNMVNTGVKNAANVQAQVQAILNAAIPTRRNRNRRALHAAVVNGKKGQKITVFVPYDPTDWQQVYRVARELSTRDATALNKVYEYWINGILSGPQTHVVNTASNTLSTLWHYGPQWFASATVNTVIRDPNSTQWGEFPKVWAGFMKGIQPAMENFALAWRTEADPVEHTYLDRPVTVMFNDAALEKAGGGRGPSIGGIPGRIIRSPGRFLVAMDAFAKTLIMHGEVSSYAYRLGKQRGLAGVALENFMASQIATHGSESWEHSLQTAKELTFQDENDITKAVEKVANAAKQAKYIGLLFKFLLPFVRTPTNIYRTGMRKAGGSAGLLLYRLGKAGFYKIHKGENFFDTYSKGKMVQDVSESVMAGALWMLAMALSEGDTDDEKKTFEITGSRPYGVANAGERASQLRQEGGSNLIIIRKNPVTGEKLADPIRIPYGRYEPMALTIGTLVDAAREFKEWSRLPGGEQTADKLAGTIMQHIAAQAQDKTFLQGISSVAQLAEDLTQNRLSIGESVAKQFVNGVVPNLIRQPLRQMRPELIDSKKPLEVLGSKTLGGALSEGQAKINEAGKPVTRRGGPVGNILFPGATEPSKALFDTALKDWNARHPGEKWNPDPITKGDWFIYDPATGSKKGRFPLKDSRQISLFEKNVGIMFDKLAAQALAKTGYRPGMKTTPDQLEAVKDARTAAIKRVRSMPPSAFTVKSK